MIDKCQVDGCTCLEFGHTADVLHGYDAYIMCKCGHVMNQHRIYYDPYELYESWVKNNELWVKNK